MVRYKTTQYDQASRGIGGTLITYFRVESLPLQLSFSVFYGQTSEYHQISKISCRLVKWWVFIWVFSIASVRETFNFQTQCNEGRECTPLFPLV